MNIHMAKLLFLDKKEVTPSLLFNGIVDAVAAGFATTKQNVTRKLKRGNSGWRYAHFDQEGKPRRSAYILKPNEKSFKQWLEEITKETEEDKESL